MADNRYRAVVAMLDDPLNRAAVTRELLRRGKLKMIPPPIPVVQGNENRGWVFVTLREALRNGAPDTFTLSDLSRVDQEALVFTDDANWFVSLVSDGGTEMGPFATAKVALTEATEYLKGEKYTILTETPWDEDDVSDYPVKV
jgi:hypothetical protein